MLRNATELAFARVISHFCIVQVFAVYDNVVMQKKAGGSNISLRRLDSSNPETGGSPVCTAIVQELCDCGSLAGALAERTFPLKVFRRSSAVATAAAVGGGGGTAAAAAAPDDLASVAVTAAGEVGGGGASVCFVDLKGVYLTLLEIALALRHLHSRRLVHRDVKPANVLLKSCPTDPRGWTCKLADFGLAAMLDRQDDDDSAPLFEQEEDGDGHDAADGGGGGGGGPPGGSSADGSSSGGRGRCWYTMQSQASGTVTHMAPEAMIPNGRIDASVDIFSLGVIFWELVCGRGRRPYPHLAVEDIPKAVAAGERPVFTSRIPEPYRKMAKACWAHEPHRRPRAADVVAFIKTQLQPSRQR